MVNTKEKYVLVKGKYGMGGRMAVLLGALMFAKRTNRTLVVDWNDGYYCPENSNDDVYSQFFLAPQSNAVDFYAQLEGKSLSIYPECWKNRPLSIGYHPLKDDNLYRFCPPPEMDVLEDIVIVTSPSGSLESDEFRDLAQEIMFHPSITEQVKRFQHEMLPGTRKIGVHIRHGNGESKVFAPDVSWFIDTVKAIKSGNESISIFLATDAKVASKFFISSFPEAKEIKKVFPQHGSLHNNSTFDCDRIENGKEALCDILLLSHCEHLIITGHYFGRVARLLGGGANSFHRYPGKNRWNEECPGKPLTKDSMIGATLANEGILLDGLRLIETAEENVSVSYGFDVIYTTNKIEGIDYVLLKERILKRRLYLSEKMNEVDRILCSGDEGLHVLPEITNVVSTKTALSDFEKQSIADFNANKDLFTAKGRIPVIFEQRDSRRKKRIVIKQGEYEKMFHSFECGEFKYYEETGKLLLDACKNIDFIGKSVVVFGLIACNCEALAIWKGAKIVYVVDYNTPISEHPNVHPMSTEEYLKKNIQVDIGISISSFEHDGLGRYGDLIFPDGDFQAMRIAKEMIKPSGLLILSVPIGPDCITWNSHRIYGPIRLPQLMTGWTITSSLGFTTTLFQTIDVGLYIQPIFILQNISKNENENCIYDLISCSKTYKPKTYAKIQDDFEGVSISAIDRTCTESLNNWQRELMTQLQKEVHAFTNNFNTPLSIALKNNRVKWPFCIKSAEIEMHLQEIKKGSYIIPGFSRECNHGVLEEKNYLGKTVLIHTNPYFLHVLIAMVQSQGARQIHIIAPHECTCDFPNVHCISFDQVVTQRMRFDTVLCIPSLSYSGLGRYDATFDPQADRKLIHSLHDLLKEDGVMVASLLTGPDHLVWNSHRIHGIQGVSNLLSDFSVVDAIDFDLSHCLQATPGKYKHSVFFLCHRLLSTPAILTQLVVVGKSQYAAIYKMTKRIVDLLKPQRVDNKSLVRIGKDIDGGYVMLDEFDSHNTTAAYSIGINADVSWDDCVANRGIDVYMYDHTIKGLPRQHPRFHFFKIGLTGSKSSDVLKTLQEMLVLNGHTKNKDLILKMDIEDCEWDVLLHTPSETIAQFRQIVFELHGLLSWQNGNRITNIERYEMMVAVLEKLNKTHQVFHLHANNARQMPLRCGEFVLTSLVEVSYIRRDDYKDSFSESNQLYPIDKVDKPNVRSRPDIFLGKL